MDCWLQLDSTAVCTGRFIGDHEISKNLCPPHSPDLISPDFISETLTLEELQRDTEGCLATTSQAVPGCMCMCTCLHIVFVCFVLWTVQIKMFTD